MNIYFSPTEHNELNFPTNNLSTIITNPITNSDKLEKVDSSIDNDNNLSKKDTETSEFYKKYRSKKDIFEKTNSQKKLNKVKVYFITKSKIVKGEEIKYAVPIRTFDDLGNTLFDKSTGVIASWFYVKKDPKSGQSKPGRRPFNLDEFVHPEPPIYRNQEFPFDNIDLPKKHVVNGDKVELFVEPEEEEEVDEDQNPTKVGLIFYELGKDGLALPMKIGLDGWDLKSDGDPNAKDPNKSTYEGEGFLFGTPTEYEYHEAALDNGFFSNFGRFSTDIREKFVFDGEKLNNGFLTRFKKLSKGGPFKLFTVPNVVELLLGDDSPIMDKNIIPVFSNLEDAQDLLITVLDEVHQPFQIRRKVEKFNSNQYSKSLSYLDDSFSSQNHYFLLVPKSKLERAQEVLIEYGDGLMKFLNLSKSSGHEFYQENKYQTKGPFFVDDISEYDDNLPMSQQPKSAPKCTWRETKYLSILHDHFPGEQETYSWWEFRDMNEADKGLLKKSQDIKIISMGLGDFLEFWNNPKKKNGDVLFIPSLNDLNKIKLPFIPKKSRDKFYDYQQKFRESKKQETENYIYEIKLSAE